MKNTALSSLFVFALLELPRSVHSFTAATTRPQPPLAGGPAVSRSRTTLLHGLKLPDFLARTPEPAEAPPETMELALEATAAETSSAETIAGKEGEEGPTETQTLLQKVKQAGTAGGECPPPPSSMDKSLLFFGRGLPRIRIPVMLKIYSFPRLA